MNEAEIVSDWRSFVNSKKRFGDRQSIYSSALMWLKTSTMPFLVRPQGKPFSSDWSLRIT
jgi:hypothetical protein